ncbi:MAG: hypothetical protein QUS14_13945 [Pyrinomonadaceae bacterium]|nr:hypothetical protein [Pyrinomonadaceae bacterium]
MATRLFLMLAFVTTASGHLAFLTACSEQPLAVSSAESSETETAPTPEPQPTKFVIPPQLANASPEELCSRLGEIKKLPYRDPNDTDPIYEALIAKGDKAVECLVAKIPDATLMPDPREAPKWEQYVIGDTAVFILLDILQEQDPGAEKLLIEMLPPAFQTEWKTNGIYAYFNYVSEPANRKSLQRWWRSWLKENKK